LRNTIVISLLLLFISSQLGYYFVYTYKQNQAKAEVKEQLKRALPESTYQVIIMENEGKAIKWEEVGKEFSLHGEMYDVAKIKKVNGQTFLYCLNDKKESQILKDFAKAIKSSTDNNSTNKNSKSGFKFQQSVYNFVELQQNKIDLFFIKQHQFPHITSRLLTVEKEVLAPPPRV
jgi:hypothetical protein